MTVLLAVVLAVHGGVALVLGANLLTLARQRRQPLPTGLPSVSVLVPARNEEHNLAVLLPTLLAQRGVDLQVVVVDDASEDGTWDVAQSHADDRLLAVRGTGPPAGWVGKPHALYQAARRATGSTFVFLDADAQLRDDGALARLVGRWQANGGPGTALTGLPRYLDRGPGALLTSLVPFAVLAALPVALVPRTRAPSLSALNGQVWVLGADDYRQLAPHEAVRDEVLEDVMIGRFLKRSGIRLFFQDLGGEVAVRMYRIVCRGVAGLPEKRLPNRRRTARSVRGLFCALRRLLGGPERALARRRRLLGPARHADAHQARHRPGRAVSAVGQRARPAGAGAGRGAPTRLGARPRRRRRRLEGPERGLRGGFGVRGGRGRVGVRGSPGKVRLAGCWRQSSAD